MNTLKVKQFWNWFSENCQDFGADFDNTNLLESLDRWVTQLGDFSWEVRPGKVKDNALIISPNGDDDLLQDTKLIVNSAKTCEGWEYYYAKPPMEKEWDLTFSIETNEKEIVDIDASQWEYVLLEYEDGMFEIIVKASDLQQLDESDEQTAVEILLDGILGEETRMRTICGVDVVEEFEEHYQDKAGTIRNLSSHIKTLIKD